MSDIKQIFIAKTTTPIKSGFLYNQRRQYKNQVGEIFQNINNNYIDLWYDTPLYGKVNTTGKFVYPGPKTINYPITYDPSGNPNIKGFDFALKALEEYMFFLTRAQIGGKTGLASLLNDFKVVSGYVDAFDNYREKLAKNVQQFRIFITKKGLQSEIKDFNKFVCQFIDTIDIVNEKATFFHHFTSNKTNLSSTGLSFRFVDADQDDDYLKNKFLQHPEFPKYIQTAANFGFRINKNSPWEIVIDVNSKPMLQNRKIKRAYDPILKRKRIVTAPGYLQEKFITSPEDFFNTYYKGVMQKSYAYFKNFLVYAYDSYRKDMRYTVNYGAPYIIPTTDYKNISTKEFFRTDSSIDFIQEYNKREFNDLYFIKKYERMLKIEFKNKTSNPDYTVFKNNFDRAINTSKSFSKSYQLLDTYYSSLSKIHDPQTKKLFWSEPKKDLTPQKNYVNLQNKPQPTIGKVVTEFISDL